MRRGRVPLHPDPGREQTLHLTDEETEAWPGGTSPRAHSKLKADLGRGAPPLPPATPYPRCHNAPPFYS